MKGDRSRCNRQWARENHLRLRIAFVALVKGWSAAPSGHLSHAGLRKVGRALHRSERSRWHVKAKKSIHELNCCFSSAPEESEIGKTRPEPTATACAAPAVRPKQTKVPRVTPPNRGRSARNVTVAVDSKLGSAVAGPSSIWEYIWPRGLLILVAAIWGTNFATVKFIGDADSLDISAGALVRFGIAALAMAPFTWKAIRRFQTDARSDAALPTNASATARVETGRKQDTRSAKIAHPNRPGMEYALGVLGLGTVVFAGYYTQAIGLLGTDANKSAFLCSLTVVLVPFMERTLFGKSIQPRAWLSALLATAGVGLLELDESTVTTFSDLWSFMQAVFFGGGFMIVEHLTRRFPGRPLEIAALNLTIVALYSGLWCLLSAISNGTGIQDVFASLAQVLIDHSTGVAGALLYTGLVTTALAVMMQTTAISKVSAEEAAVIFCLEPLFAVAFSAALLGENMSLKGALGGALILFAVLSNQALNPEMRARLRSPLAFVDDTREASCQAPQVDRSDSEVAMSSTEKPEDHGSEPDLNHNGQVVRTRASKRLSVEDSSKERYLPAVTLAVNEVSTAVIESSENFGKHLDLHTGETIIADVEEMASVHG
jgi:drug/metabolite transporter (DMT)-like permease